MNPLEQELDAAFARLQEAAVPAEEVGELLATLGEIFVAVEVDLFLGSKEGVSWSDFERVGAGSSRRHPGEFLGENVGNVLASPPAAGVTLDEDQAYVAVAQASRPVGVFRIQFAEQQSVEANSELLQLLSENYGQPIERLMLHRELHLQMEQNRSLVRGEVRHGRAMKAANEMRREAEDRLQHAAFHDALTGLPNRSLFLDRLNHAMRRRDRNSEVQFGLLCLDLDRFKVVNDSLGHTIGDQLLVAIAARLRRCVRPSDTLARLGGDEFTILLEDIQDVRHAIRVAERILGELSQPFHLAEQEIFTNASIGIAVSENNDTAQTLMQNADLAMYRAKARGRACHEVFDGQMSRATAGQLELETALHRGLERGEFRVHYQPVVGLSDGKLHGFEALVRWQHPDRGLLTPAAFLDAADDSGLIVPLGSWVLKEACRQLAEWRATPHGAHLTVSVNLAGKQLQSESVVKETASALESNALPAEGLILEITEDLIMKNASEAIEILVRLRDLGVHLHMDDFGTGYSSLSYIRRFPLNALKIDRSFVRNMSGEDAAIVRTILTLAENLNLGVIAEGVETEEQRIELSALGCPLGQGYYFAAPISPEDASTLVLQGQAFPSEEMGLAAQTGPTASPSS